MNTLEILHIAKSYQKRQVVKDISLTVNQGQIVGLLGPNGAGKTTTFYMIVGITKAEKGKIILNGEDITKLAMHNRSKKGMGYLPQETSVFRKLSVANNIMAILQTRKDLNRKQRKEKLAQLMDEFNITHLQKNKGASLSGGEKRRVEIARTLATEPNFILLDEPFAGVDPISVSDIKNIIKHLKDKGIGVLITDHNVRETLDICDNAYIVGDGNIIAEGSTKQILNNQLVKDTYLGHQFKL